MNIALIGCGAIGTALLELVQDEPGVHIAAIVVPPSSTETARAVAARLAARAQVVQAVPHTGIDLLVEVAGHSALAQHVLPALERGVAAIVASVGAVCAPGLLDKLEAAARTGRTQVQLIAGAIGAIDALAAARLGGLDSVRYTGRKPPRAWLGTPAENGRDLTRLATETVIFEGNAREAARLYPKNANVAATVSLAGLGLDDTIVRLIADPGVAENIHQLEASGAFGQFELSLRNQPLAANPKTSALTVYSAVRALRARVAPVVI